MVWTVVMKANYMKNRKQVELSAQFNELAQNNIGEILHSGRENTPTRKLIQAELS